MKDISNELRHYKNHFAGKTVLCNCDDPFESNFFKFFALNFNSWSLKKLICTCYGGSKIVQGELFVDKSIGIPERKAYKAVITEVSDVNGDGAIDLLDIKQILQSNPPEILNGDGDFRSKECIEILKEADIVVTNPPFSLFRDYIAQLFEYNKKFLIIGNQNEVTYQGIYPLIMQNKLWLGYNSGDMSFTVPDDYEPKETRYWEDKNGQKWRSMGNICWFTNLDHKKRHEPFDSYKKYNPEDYPKYDNYDAINVDKVVDIPCDYYGVMGVPITFLNKYNPEEFEIVAFRKGKDGKDLIYSLLGGVENNLISESSFATSIPGLIKNAEGKINNRITYARITIRRLKK